MPKPRIWKLPDTPQATDGFAGAGGSAVGLTQAGIHVVTALDHNEISLASHAANHPTTHHHQVDITQADPYDYPRCNILWMSPECTHFSSASGNALPDDRQMTIWDEYAPSPAHIRSRMAMMEVVRYASAHLSPVVIIENVIEVVKWARYAEWWQAMLSLGYEGQELYLNAACFGTPSSRDRYYGFFWKDTRKPDLDFHPTAWCFHCDCETSAQQNWLTPHHRGKYKVNYDYVCPACRRRVNPYAVPVASILDWHLPTTRIGDRKKPLAQNTLNRIRWGLQNYGTVAPSSSTMLAASPFILSYYGRDNANSSIQSALPTVTPSNRHQLVVPPQLSPNVNREPLTAEAINALLPDCRTRLLEPNELARAMGFPDGYILIGTKSQAISQIGNAVAVPIARLLGGVALELVASRL